MVQFFGGFEGAAQTPRVRIARFGSGVYKIFEVKICLNMNSKTDKENRSYDDIAFLSEIIVNFRFWQGILKVCKSNFYVINTALKFIVLF